MLILSIDIEFQKKKTEQKKTLIKFQIWFKKKMIILYYCAIIFLNIIQTLYGYGRYGHAKEEAIRGGKIIDKIERRVRERGGG